MGGAAAGADGYDLSDAFFLLAYGADLSRAPREISLGLSISQAQGRIFRRGAAEKEPSAENPAAARNGRGPTAQAGSSRRCGAIADSDTPESNAGSGAAVGKSVAADSVNYFAEFEDIDQQSHRVEQREDRGFAQGAAN